MIRYFDGGPIEALTSFTNSIDLVGISFHIHGENRWMVTYRFAIIFHLFGNVFVGFSQEWIKRFACAAKDLCETRDYATRYVNHTKKRIFI